MQEEKRRNDSAIAEEKVKLILESQAKEAKQVRVSSCKSTSSFQRKERLCTSRW
jgi:hypothetical protein